MVKAHPPYTKRMRLFMKRENGLQFKNVVARVICAALISIGWLGWCEQQEAVNWCDVSDFWASPTESKMTFVDLFCGAGGLSKGLEFAGLKGVCGLDYFEAAERTYRRNFTHQYVNGDVTIPEVRSNLYRIVREELHGERLGVIVGGFPCQGFSMAGNRVVNDPRNSLYRDMVEIVNELKPDFVVCENVKGLRSMLGGAVEKKIVADYKAIGYEMKVATLCAADYYVPQKRERVIFIGNRIGRENYHPKPLLSSDQYVTVEQAIGDLTNRCEDAAFNHIFTKHRSDMVERMRKLKEGESVYDNYSEAWRRCSWKQPSPTVKENHGGVMVHPILPRVMTVRELARLQSFPDDFLFEGGKSQQLIQVGNAVPVLLGKAIGLSLRCSAGELKE